MSETVPSLPPLFRGEAAEAPFEAAVQRARTVTDPGLVTYRIQPDRLTAGLVLAPETPLEDAMAMLLVAANGFADAFGALAPSEIACHIEWPGGLRVNGARCGRLRAAASTRDPMTVPDWLVIGIDVPVFARSDREPGETPNETTLWDEGCAEIDPQQLLESWARHTLVWIHDWLEDGMGRIHRDWMGRAYGLGEEIHLTVGCERVSGTFTGLDERGGLLLKQKAGVRLVPLTAILEEA